jgi:hypothetical protein
MFGPVFIKISEINGLDLKPSFLVPPQQAFLERTSKETRHDIVPKLCMIENNRCYVF